MMEFQAIKIQYFLGTNRLYIELEAAEIAETKDLDENILLDINTAGNVRAITIEYASQRTGIHTSQLSKLPLKKALTAVAAGEPLGCHPRRFRPAAKATSTRPLIN
jgi:uncharacterized protein YuzE